MAASDETNKQDAVERQFNLAITVFRSSFWFITAFVIAIIVLWVLERDMVTGDGSDPFLPLDIFHTVLPIVSGWIGVVLGYYFSDRAAQTRGDQVLKAAQGPQALSEKLREVGVIDDMIPLGEIEKVILRSADDPKGPTMFSELRAVVDNPRYSRAPVFVPAGNGNLRYHAIAHESAIYRYDSNVRAAMQDPDTKTIVDFLSHKDSEDYIKDTTVFVSRRATLEDAKLAMTGRRGCQDVFVTSDGTSTGYVEGWLPNVWILQKTIKRAEA